MNIQTVDLRDASAHKDVNWFTYGIPTLLKWFILTNLS